MSNQPESVYNPEASAKKETTNKKQRIKLTQSQWRQLILEQATGDLNVTDYCRAKGINKSVFYNNKKLLNKDVSKKFLEITPLKNQQTDKSSVELEVELPSGYIIRGYSNTEVSKIGSLIRLLGGHKC